jgi:hypothetical protein
MSVNGTASRLMQRRCLGGGLKNPGPYSISSNTDRAQLVGQRSHQRTPTRLPAVLAIALVIMLASGLPAWAQAGAPLQYSGGPVLRTFTIYPLYYGSQIAVVTTHVLIKPARQFICALCFPL